jgi:hypothetical protein
MKRISSDGNMGLLDDSNLIRGFKSAQGRIPNFQGVPEAALNLQKTKEWGKSKNYFLTALILPRERFRRMPLTMVKL